MPRFNCLSRHPPSQNVIQIGPSEFRGGSSSSVPSEYNLFSLIGLRGDSVYHLFHLSFGVRYREVSLSKVSLCPVRRSASVLFVVTEVTLFLRHQRGDWCDPTHRKAKSATSIRTQISQYYHDVVERSSPSLGLCCRRCYRGSFG